MNDNLEPSTLYCYRKKGFTHLPITQNLRGHYDSAYNIFTKLANKPFTYLLESAVSGQEKGRYSIVGLATSEFVSVSGNTVSVYANNTAVKQLNSFDFKINTKLLEEVTVQEPLDWIRNYQAKFKVVNTQNLPKFFGGLVGYFGYETAQLIEPKLCNPKLISHQQGDLNVPDIMLMVSTDLIILDNKNKISTLVTMCDLTAIDLIVNYNEALDRATKIADELNNPAPSMLATKKRDVKAASDKIKYHTTKQQFMADVQIIKEHITKGDVMQVVPSQRMSLPFNQDPLNLYRAIRHINPSPYLFYYNFGDFHIAGASPEILTQLEDNIIKVRPLAGTRPRGATAEEDMRLVSELLNDEKEVAEHLMLIDLARNDVGRVAQVGTVRVTAQMQIEKYSHVMHIVSSVEGKVRPELDAIDVLKASFPAGTLSGAPKIRAMEIISTLEPCKRSIYGGGCGYIGWNGNMDICIAIRTAIVKDNVLYAQAGGGVVYDSVPELEWMETINKSKSILDAVDLLDSQLFAKVK